MTCNLDAVKAYMVVEDAHDDALITALIQAAEGYLAGAGIQPRDPPDERYVLAVCALTLHWYDNRQVVDSGLQELPLGLRPLINQLKAEGVPHDQS